MKQQQKADHFAALHHQPQPLKLYNIWDAGSALQLAGQGVDAIATGSWSCAAAQGYQDGEVMPFTRLLHCAERIVASVDLPVSIDFETGYSSTLSGMSNNLRALLDIGIVGINIEDQVMSHNSIQSCADQCRLIAALRETAERAAVPLFINARTDLFLQQPDARQHAGLLDQALAREQAYRQAGANGFFTPGLTDIKLIGSLCAGSTLPVNIMVDPDSPDAAALACAGVARISYGPLPYIRLMEMLAQQWRTTRAA